MNDHLPSGVLRFWFGAGEEYGRRHKRWFEKDPSFDAEVSKRFLPLYEELAAGAGREWLESRADCLARIIALDQFPRQLFRGSARAFAADALALEAARHAITRGYDRNMLPVERMPTNKNRRCGSVTRGPGSPSVLASPWCVSLPASSIS